MKLVPILCSLLFSFSAHTSEIVAATLVMEAGGERDKLAMPAVYSVINNRAKAAKKSQDSVCLANKQFSCWNGITKAQGIEKAKQHPKWTLALKIASQPPEYNSNLTHYHNTSVAPKWAKGKKALDIGKHKFYALR